jgi:hypothetical protein|tara:strand:+ start:23308 stop:26211 length:2904 start_codon:yes stop_codon:yes gene_type:complete
MANFTEALRQVYDPKPLAEQKLPEEILDDDASDFIAAAGYAKNKGKKTFKFGGKEYPVTISDKTAKASTSEEKDADEDGGTRTEETSGTEVMAESDDYLGMAKKLLTYAKKHGGIDERDFIKVSGMLQTLGKNSSVQKQDDTFKKMAAFINDLDTDPKEYLSDFLRKGLGKDRIEKLLKIRFREEFSNDLIERMKMNDPKLAKIFDKAKKLDIIKIKFDSSIKKGTEFLDFVVKSKGTVRKGTVGKIAMYRQGNPTGMKYFLYQRDGGVSLAIGDMAASIVDIKEEVVLDEASKDGTVRIIDLGNKKQDKIRKELGVDKLPNKGFQVQVMTKGKFVNQGDPYKTQKDAEKVRSTGQHSMQFEASAKSSTGYDLYHKTFSGAMAHAYDSAKKKGFVVDMDDVSDKVAVGPKKPSKGKTNSYILDTDKKNKKLHIQVANLDNKRYELNMYIDSVEFDRNDNLVEFLNSIIIVEAKKDIDPADIDNDATISDKDAAKMNIIVQLRKAADVNGNTPIKFADKKKQKVDIKFIQYALDKFAKIRKPADKERFQNSMARSYRDMLMTLKTFKEEVELDEAKATGKQVKALNALMLKALGIKKMPAKHDYTSTIADNGDFVVSGGQGQVSGRIKKGAFVDPMKEELDEAAQILAHGGKGQYKAVSQGGVVSIKYKGKEVASGDFDRGADGWFISYKGMKKGDKTFFDDAQDMVDYLAKKKVTESVELEEGKMKEFDAMVKKGMTAAQIAKKIGMKEKDVAEFMKSMDETKESVELDEAKKIKFSAKEIKMAIGIATDKRYAGTNYSGAARMIDKIKDGLSDFPQVAAVLKRANESVVELDEAASLIPQLQTIVQDKQHAKIKGMVVDLFTASMITQIYDKVNDANKAKMDKLPLEKLVNIAHKMMKREETLQTEVFVEGLIQESDKTDAKEMSDMVKTLNPKIKLADLKKEVQDIAMEKYKNKTRASKIASMVK